MTCHIWLLWLVLTCFKSLLENRGLHVTSCKQRANIVSLLQYNTIQLPIPLQNCYNTQHWQMVDLISCKLVVQTNHLTIKSAFFPAFLGFRTSVCLLTCNISLSWVVLTLALTLKGWRWVSLSRWDMPVCFGLYSATLSVDSIRYRHPCKRTNLDVFQCMLFSPTSLTSAQVTTPK